MAHFHLHASHGSRSGGQSAGAKADYITREGRYAQRPGLVLVESGNLPDWAGSAREFWSAADTYSRANARLYTEVEMALPRELDLHAQVQLAQEMVDELATIDGARIPYTWALHDSGDGNPHVHVVLSAKADDGYQRTPAQWFARAASKGRPAQSGGARSWSEATDKVWLESRRESWATRQNQAYELAGLDVRVDHRSYARRGIEQAPQMHEGWGRRAESVRRINEAVHQANAELGQARQAVQALTLEQRRARKAQAQEPHLQAEREAWERVQAERKAVGDLERDYKACGIYASKEQFFRLRDAREGLKRLEEGHAELVRRRLGDRAPEALAALNAPSQVQEQAEPGQRRERSPQQARGDLPLPPGYGEAPSPSQRDAGGLPLPPGHPDRVEVHLPKRSRSHSQKM